MVNNILIIIFFFLKSLIIGLSQPPIQQSYNQTTYNNILWPGTHNSYCNLNNSSPTGHYYPKDILNQQWSITEQLDKKIRVLDIELNSVKKCPDKKKECTFIVSHGNEEEVKYLDFGYSFLDDILIEIKEWIQKQTKIEPITLILNKQDSRIENREIFKIFNKTNTQDLVFLYDTDISPTFNNWPTITQIQHKHKPLMVFGLNDRRIIHYQNWYISPTCSAYNDQHNTPLNYTDPKTHESICINEGWDGSQLENFYPENLIITDINTCKTSGCLFILNILLSPRHLIKNFPFIFGGNPLTQVQANTNNILYNLIQKANQFLSKNKQQVNWILVDFFNTIYDDKTFSWADNPNDDLISVVHKINHH